jgi:hypothetical protein
LEVLLEVTGSFGVFEVTVCEEADEAGFSGTKRVEAVDEGEDNRVAARNGRGLGNATDVSRWVRSVFVFLIFTGGRGAKTSSL